jgi:hypothetical protein
MTLPNFENVFAVRLYCKRILAAKFVQLGNGGIKRETTQRNVLAHLIDAYLEDVVLEFMVYLATYQLAPFYPRFRRYGYTCHVVKF